MRNHVVTFFLAGVATLAFPPAAPAQMAQPSGTAKPSAARAPTAVHDLSGVWNMHILPGQGNFLGVTFTADPPAMTAWGTEKYNANKPSNGPRTHSLKETDDPVLSECLPPGTPRIYLHPYPFQIFQTPKEIILIFEYDHTVRQIFTDGRPHPDDLTPTYMGNSIGKWEGDTLVVDTIGFNEKTWLDRDGHSHSDQLHVVERFHRIDRANMTVDIDIQDPKALVKPWDTRLNFQLKPDWDLMELVCTDNGAFENFEK